MTTQLDFKGVFGALERPGIAETQPLVGGFYLPAVANLLIEDAVFIANAVADGGNVEGGERIHKARGKPAQPAIAQTRFGLLLDQRFQVKAELAHRFFGFVVKAEVD